MADRPAFFNAFLRFEFLIPDQGRTFFSDLSAQVESTGDAGCDMRRDLVRHFLLEKNESASEPATRGE